MESVEDYPRTEAGFEKRFGLEEACRDYACRLRWPEGFRCPRCGQAKAWRVRSAHSVCELCVPSFFDSGDDLSGHAHSP